MTNQEIFDKVSKHLLEQGEKAAISGHCMYRMPGGKKCAAGCLIPDELYDPIIEGNGVGFGTEVDRVLRKAGFRVLQFPLISKLQDIHDCTSSPSEWRAELERLAKKHGFNTEVLNGY